MPNSSSRRKHGPRLILPETESTKVEIEAYAVLNSYLLYFSEHPKSV